MTDILPRNPLEPAKLEELESTEASVLFDRIRRNYELIEGSPVQEDASFSDRIELAPGQKVDVTIRPGNEKEFLVDEINVNPALSDAEYELVADDTVTDASILPFGVATRVHNKIKVSIKNGNGATQKFTVVTDARQVQELN